jgi:hypothetical protein
MDSELLNTLINAGTGGILLFLYLRLEQRFDSLQKQLHETNLRLWGLLEELIKADELRSQTLRRIEDLIPPNTRER